MTIPDGAEFYAGPPTARQRRAGVLGFPAAHSLSPTIHRRGYELCGLDGWRYDIFELRPDEVEPFLDSLDDTWRGFSVTMPLKETVARLGIADPLVSAMGVANTIVLERGEHDVRRVYNTDVPGFQRAIATAGVASVRSTMVLGSGATALSALVAVGSLGSRVLISARNPVKAAALAARGVELGFATEVVEWGVYPSVDGVISTVPSDAIVSHLPGLLDAAPGFVFDVIYHPWPTPLAQAGQRIGVPVISGLDLLVHQARVQFELFTGHTVAAEPLLLAVRAAAAARAGT